MFDHRTVEVARRDAEAVGIEFHAVLACAVFAHELHEAVAHHLLAAVGLARGDFFGNGAEEPEEKALHEVGFLQLAELRLRPGEEHLRDVHPEVDFAPRLLAAVVGRVAVAGMLVRVVEIRGVDGQHGREEDGLGKEQHPRPEVIRSVQDMNQAAGQEDEFRLLVEGVLLCTRGDEGRPPDANEIDATLEMTRRLAQGREVGLHVAYHVGVRGECLVLNRFHKVPFCPAKIRMSTHTTLICSEFEMLCTI